MQGMFVWGIGFLFKQMCVCGKQDGSGCAHCEGWRRLDAKPKPADDYLPKWIPKDKAMAA